MLTSDDGRCREAQARMRRCRIPDKETVMTGNGCRIVDVIMVHLK